ncbi:DUF4397 domain-containing protein [Cytobacillus oceanisediminis]|uniref:DUF4397 domain-containing protein n=1 Tax=Cytobacillus oceanisediminis TaxID=665099 RepID=UPI00203CB973|nr:DUF4397 domain-containing protein [Cytobacillus oceanisediminis]MCM3394959.1 DUF4397 domain-containing protein [Cytobacillus oceanisediminis]
MASERNRQWYFQRAAKYDLLSQYFKYIDPAQHIAYYYKHLHCLNQAFQIMRTQNQQPSEGQQAKVRIFHGSPDAGQVDIYVDGTRILKDFHYKEASGYASLPAGKHQIDIYRAGNMVSTLLSRKIIAAAGKAYTIAAAGIASKLKLVILEDHHEVPAGETKVRFAHLSADASAVDIAVKNRDVVFPNIAFRQASKYLALTPMTVDLEARISGTPNVALAIPRMQFQADQAYTLLAVGSVANEPVLEAILIPD